MLCAHRGTLLRCGKPHLSLLVLQQGCITGSVYHFCPFWHIWQGEISLFLLLPLLAQSLVGCMDMLAHVICCFLRTTV